MDSLILFSVADCYRWRPSLLLVSCLALLMSAALPLLAADTADGGENAEVKVTTARLYRSPEERREAGVGTEMTEWLTFSGLAETETEWIKEKRQDGGHSPSERNSSPALQLGFEAELSDELTAQLIFEYDAELGATEVDEAVIEFDTERWSMTVGRESVSFGEYYSHFSTGPLLEFGEVNADAVTLGYKPIPGLEVFLYGFEGKVGKRSADHSQWDVGAGLEWSTDEERLVFGMGYLSDLGESDEAFFKDDGNLYEERVAAVNAYLLMAFEQFEITAEVLKTADRIKGFDPEVDQPRAFNLEIAALLNPRWQLAFRWEGSRELEDEPKVQTGISSAWLLGEHLYLSVDYLYGRYEKGFVEDNDDNELTSRQTTAIQLSYEF